MWNRMNGLYTFCDSDIMKLKNRIKQKSPPKKEKKKRCLPPLHNFKSLTIYMIPCWHSSAPGNIDWLSKLHTTYGESKLVWMTDRLASQNYRPKTCTWMFIDGYMYTTCVIATVQCHYVHRDANWTKYRQVSWSAFRTVVSFSSFNYKNNALKFT